MLPSDVAGSGSVVCYGPQPSALCAQYICTEGAQSRTTTLVMILSAAVPVQLCPCSICCCFFSPKAKSTSHTETEVFLSLQQELLLGKETLKPMVLI